MCVYNGITLLGVNPQLTYGIFNESVHDELQKNTSNYLTLAKLRIINI